MGSDQDGTFDPFKQFGIFGIAFLIINAVLLFMGLGLVTVGAQALNELSKINSENIKPLLELDSVQAVVMVTAVSIILIVIGILLTLGAFGLGIAGAYFKTKFILLQYAIFVLILLLMKIVVIALWFTMKNEVETDMQDKMVTILHSYYLDDGTTSSYPISNAWNYLFLTGCYAALKEKLLYHSLSIIVLALTTTFIEVKALSLVFLIRGKNRQQCLTLCRNMCVSPSVGVAPDKSRWI
nr:uncharacterized protein LOC105320172 isoform X3 [Crassostrea gigas]